MTGVKGEQDPVIATGAFTPVGHFAAAMRGGLLGLTGLIQGRRRSGGLPSRVLVAVTPDHLRIYRVDIRWRPTMLLREFARQDVKVTVRPNGGVSTIEIEFDRGRVIELQGVDGGAVRVAAALTARAGDSSSSLDGEAGTIGQSSGGGR
jgi:hypothetical protein